MDVLVFQAAWSPCIYIYIFQIENKRQHCEDSHLLLCHINNVLVRKVCTPGVKWQWMRSVFCVRPSRNWSLPLLLFLSFPPCSRSISPVIMTFIQVCPHPDWRSNLQEGSYFVVPKSRFCKDPEFVLKWENLCGCFLYFRVTDKLNSNIWNFKNIWFDFGQFTWK